MGTSRTPSAMRTRLTNLGAVVGGIATFFAIGALDEVIKVAIGTAVGWLVGLALYVNLERKQQERRVADLRARPRSELLKEAGRLDIEGRSDMTKEQLIEAIEADEENLDEAAAAMKDTLDGAKEQFSKVVSRRRSRSRGRGRRS